MAHRLQYRRDTKANWLKYNPVLMEGEVGYETDTHHQKVGDGVSTYSELEYEVGVGNITQETGDSESLVMSQKAVTEKLSELGSEVNTFPFKLGTINGETGIEEESNNRLTSGFIDVNLIDSVETTDGYKVYCRFYDKNKTYLKDKSIYFANKLSYSALHIGNYYIRLTLKNEDDTQFSENSAKESIIINSINGLNVVREAFEQNLIEQGEKYGGIVKFEQGTLNSGNNSEADNRIRTVGFIDSWFSIKLKEGYKIYRVSRYNNDNSYNSYIEVNSNFYNSQDSTYKYRFTIVKSDGGNITPNDDFLEEFKSGIPYIQSNVKNLSYVDWGDMLEWGYYKTSVVGDTLGEIVESTVRKHVYITNVVDGDIYVVRASSGSTSYIWAKIKDGIIISSGNNSSEVVIQCDGSFDSLVFNVDIREEYYIYSYINHPNTVISKKIGKINDDVLSLKDKVSVIGTTDIILEQGTISQGVEQDSANRLRSGFINSGFFLSVKDGYQIYRLVEYGKDKTYIRNITLSKPYVYMPNKEGFLYRILVSKKNINTSLSPFEDIIEEYSDGIRYSEKMIQSGESLYYNFHNANIVIIGDSAVAASDWANRMCNEIKCNKHIVSAVGGQTLRTRLTSDGSLDNCLRKNLENTVIPHIDNNWGGKVDIIMIQEGGNDLGSISGSLDDAFSDTNYLSYRDDLTTYGSLRYCLELIKRKYPLCLVTMGTVFGRRGSDWNGNADSINEVITSMCRRFSIQIIEGNKYCGFAPITEPIEPYYGDGAPGVVGGGGTLSREQPAYNYVDSNNNIVDYETATNDGILKDGYSKRYGLYTYDGKHQNLQGEEKVLKFMKSELIRLYTT